MLRETENGLDLSSGILKDRREGHKEEWLKVRQCIEVIIDGLIRLEWAFAIDTDTCITRYGYIVIELKNVIILWFLREYSSLYNLLTTIDKVFRWWPKSTSDLRSCPTSCWELSNVVSSFVVTIGLVVSSFIVTIGSVVSSFIVTIGSVVPFIFTVVTIFRDS